jgi:hypothetical protein
LDATLRAQGITPESDPQSYREAMANLQAKLSTHQPATTINTGDVKLTESQGKGASYGLRAKSSDSILRDLEAKDANEIGSVKHWGLSKMGTAGNALLPEDLQLYNQAAREFISAAILRSDSGATVTDSDYKQYYPIYFPMPGDSAAVKSQKAESRRIAIVGQDIIAGPGARVAQEKNALSKEAPTSGLGQSRNKEIPKIAPPELPKGTIFYKYSSQGNRVWKLPNGAFTEEVQ